MIISPPGTRDFQYVQHPDPWDFLSGKVPRSMNREIDHLTADNVLWKRIPLQLAWRFMQVLHS